MIKTCIVVIVASLSVPIIMDACAASDAPQGTLQVETRNVDYMRFVMGDGGPVLVAASRRSMTINGSKTFNVSQWAATCYKLRNEDAKLDCQKIGYFYCHDFKAWTIYNIQTNKVCFVGYDVEGTNPLEPTNNPMGRLTMASADVTKDVQDVANIGDNEARAAFSAKYAVLGRRSYIRGEGILFEDAINIDVASNGKELSMCVGITKGEGVWAKAFKNASEKWDKELGLKKGDYADLAVTAAKNGIGIVTVDVAGRVSYCEIKSAMELARAQDESVAEAASWKSGDGPLRVCVTSNDKDIVVGVLLGSKPTAANNSRTATDVVDRELLVFRRRPDGGQWQRVGNCSMEPSCNSISLALSGDAILCAYVYEKNGETFGTAKVLALNTPFSQPAR